VEKILALAAGDESPEDTEILRALVVPLKNAIDITSRSECNYCSLLEDIVAIDVRGNVMLCCGCSMNKQNVIGGFLDLPMQQIQRRRRENPLCGPCMKHGIPTYFAGHPSFGEFIDAEAAQ
jgi:hypothetical protein